MYAEEKRFGVADGRRGNRHLSNHPELLFDLANQYYYFVP